MEQLLFFQEYEKRLINGKSSFPANRATTPGNGSVAGKGSQILWSPSSVAELATFQQRNAEAGPLLTGNIKHVCGGNWAQPTSTAPVQDFWKNARPCKSFTFFGGTEALRTVKLHTSSPSSTMDKCLLLHSLLEMQEWTVHSHNTRQQN